MTHDDYPHSNDGSGFALDPNDDVVTQVIAELQARKPVSRSGMRMPVLDDLLERIKGIDPFDAEEIHDTMRRAYVSDTQLLAAYVPAAARIMGNYWMRDEESFATVTIAGMRLQSLVSHVARGNTVLQNRGNVLVVVPENEQHFLGGTLISAQMGRLGFAAHVSVGETSADIAARALVERPDIVMFTSSTGATLASVLKTVQIIRNAPGSAPVFALGGPIVAEIEGQKEAEGVDILTCNLAEVVGLFERRIKERRRA